MISLIAFLPVLIAFFFCLSSICLFIKARATNLNKCRRDLLSIQQSMVRSLNSLTALNPRAEYLRAEEAALKAQIPAAAGYPPALAALEARIAANQAQQALLHSQQMMIISSAKASATTKLARLKLDLDSTSTTTTQPTLAVRATPATAIAPNYEPVHNFEWAQSIRVEWITPVDTYLSALAKNGRILPALKGKCSATISKDTRNTWTEKLGTASL